ncbi:MAG: VanZ family protein [Steroidobacteraceae bacterium]
MTPPLPQAAPPAGRRELRLARLWWLMGWLLLLGVVYACLEPSSSAPNLHVNDKIEHAAAYFLMGFWFGGLLEQRSYPLLAFGLLFLGALIEVAQAVMGWGRTGDVRDFIADAVGVAASLALVYAGLGSWLMQLERRCGLSHESS